jgi:hypothetical protein
MDHLYEPRSTTIALVVEVFAQRPLHSLSVEAMDAVANKDHRFLATQAVEADGDGVLFILEAPFCIFSSPQNIQNR